MTTTEGIEIEELLTHIWATGAVADPLVRRLADYVDRLLDEVQEDDGQSDASPDEEGPAIKQAREGGWQHGLEVAYSLVETVEGALHEMPDPDGMNTSAKQAGDRGAKAIESAQNDDSDKYTEPEELSDQGDRREMRTRAPQQVVPTAKGATARDCILETIPVGRSELRENVVRMLTKEAHRLPPSTVSMALGRLIDDGKHVKEVQVGKHKVLECVA